MKTLLLLTLFCLPINVYAVKWEKVGIDKLGSTQYIDIDDIKKSNGLIYYRVLINNLKPLKNGTHSSIGKWRVNCAVGKITWLSLTSYIQPMGKGEITTLSYHSSNLAELTPNKILYPKSNSSYYNLLKFVCKNA